MKSSFTVALLLAVFLSSGQNYYLDIAFGDSGHVVMPQMVNFYESTKILCLPDSGFLVAANYEGSNVLQLKGHLYRFKDNGQIDSSFGLNGMIDNAIFNSFWSIYDMNLMPDGKILVAGHYDLISPPYHYYKFALHRFLPNGILDSAFGTNGVVILSYPLESISSTMFFYDYAKIQFHLQANSKITVTGNFFIDGDLGNPSYDSLFISRYHFDGAIDSGFGTNGFMTEINNGEIFTLVQSDGKIVRLGDNGYIFYGFNSLLKATRYDTLGNVDSTFGQMGHVNYTPPTSNFYLHKAIQDSNNRILVIGTNYQHWGYTPNYVPIFNSDTAFVSRLDQNGFLDTTFGNQGWKIISSSNNEYQFNSAVLTSNNGLLISGRKDSAYIVVKLKENGELDSAFGLNGFIEGPALFNPSSNEDLMYSNTGSIVTVGVTGNKNSQRLFLSKYMNCPGITIPVTNNAPTLFANISGVKYQWVDCLNNYAILPGDTNQSFTATQNGSYAVIVNDNGCVDTSQCATVDNVSIEEYSNSGIRIFPNPASNTITLENLRQPFDANTEVVLYDLLGNKLLQELIGEAGKTYQLHVGHLNAGIYILQVAQDQEVIVTERIVIQK